MDNPSSAYTSHSHAFTYSSYGFSPHSSSFFKTQSTSNPRPPTALYFSSHSNFVNKKYGSILPRLSTHNHKSQGALSQQPFLNMNANNSKNHQQHNNKKNNKNSKNEETNPNSKTSLNHPISRRQFVLSSFFIAAAGAFEPWEKESSPSIKHLGLRLMGKENKRGRFHEPDSDEDNEDALHNDRDQVGFKHNQDKMDDSDSDSNIATGSMMGTGVGDITGSAATSVAATTAPHLHIIDSVSTDTSFQANIASTPDIPTKDDVDSLPDVIIMLNRTATLAFISLYCIVANNISDRYFSTLTLPKEYDIERITGYFLLRPEKVAFRILYVSSQTVTLGTQYLWDALGYSLATNRDRFYTRRIILAARFYQQQSQLNPAAYHVKIVGNVLSFIENRFGTAKERKQKRDEYWEWRQTRTASKLRETITRLGPAFIKLGQALGSRPDLVGRVTANELMRLQDDMPFFSNDDAFKFITTEVGQHPKKIFSYFSDQPVAAASLGQVYKGELDGIPVAIKVQRPGVVEQIALDFLVVRAFGAVLSRILKIRTRLIDGLDDYASRLFEEADYECEGRNMCKFRKLYGGIDGIYIPQVFQDYSTTHVITMEWVDGKKLMDEKSGFRYVRKEDLPLIETGIRCSLIQLLETGFLHADPHAGNLVKTPNGKLAYLDFGLVSIIPVSVQHSIIRAIFFLINKEYLRLADEFAGLNLMRVDDLEKERLALSSELQAIFDPVLKDGLASFTFHGVAERLLLLSVKFPLVFPSYFVSNVRAIATLEGLAITADPTFQIMKVIYPYVVSRVLYESDEDFQEALADAIVDERGQIRWKRIETLVNAAEESIIPCKSNSQLLYKDEIVRYVTSPGGKFLRRLLVKQMVMDIDIRFQRNLDAIERVLLPEKMRPPPVVLRPMIGKPVMQKLRARGNYARQIVVRTLSALRFRALIRLFPLMLRLTLRGLRQVTFRIVRRLWRDFGYIIGSFREQKDKKDKLQTATASVAPAPVVAAAAAAAAAVSSINNNSPVPVAAARSKPTRNMNKSPK